MKKSNKSSRNRPKIIMRVIWKWKVITKFWQVDRIKRSMLFIVNLGKYCIASSTLHRVVLPFDANDAVLKKFSSTKMLYGNLSIVLKVCIKRSILFEVSNYSSIYLSYLISTNSMTTSNCLRLIASIKFGIFFALSRFQLLKRFLTFIPWNNNIP